MDFKQAREKLLEDTRKAIADAITPDLLIIQQLAAIDDITIQVNNLSSRLREWHGYFLPEVGHQIDDNEHFAQTVATQAYNDLKGQYVTGQVMGNSNTKTYEQVKSFANFVYAQFCTRKSYLDELEKAMKEQLPNITALAGPTIGARLLAEAGSLRNLALMPASTIQLLGAEKALFRHLRGGSRSPKHGHIFNHQLIQRAKRDMRGKVARALGDKLALCAKLDFFKGDQHGTLYLAELEKKFS